MKYKRMGIIGALRIVSAIADANPAVNYSSSEVCLRMKNFLINVTFMLKQSRQMILLDIEK
jgi:hypothetical protein